MFATSMRGILPVIVLSLTLLGPAAHPAQAQTLTHAQIDQLLKQRLDQANALNSLIQQTGGVPAAAAPFQAALSQVQYQISILRQLRATIDQAFAVDRLIQDVQRRIFFLSQSSSAFAFQQITVLQAAISNLQAQLVTIQAQINTLQAQITP